MELEVNNSENKFSDVPLRVKTWSYIILVFAISISSSITMKLFISWIGCQVLYEFLRMFQVKRNLLITALSLGIVQFSLLYFLYFEHYFLYAVAFLITFLIYFLMLKVTVKQGVGIVIGLSLSLLIFPHLLYLRESAFGIKALIYLVVLTELNDVFQYFMGKLFGNHKVMPKISPNKTWEGVIGGVFLTTVLSTILGYFLLTSTILIHVILGIILGVSGFFGDVFMSLLKRKTNMKDTGALLPGHGGLMDRMDSLIFNAPIFFWVLPLLIKS
ncbi:CDP-archaeol synthase [Cellulophaga sp. HaHaR_3_176]|uniref:phosphatidate cytidylyltransferase n=1 Tax=Cellulophaga sp. HaHaR_3_176 TaxID=1942464 RepID=UPI001C1FA3F7|nr:CDP-archaeol synthase [Cellulophaga sp. HaHaR_3_176]QWX85122.1 CDP-archaeol synthase [Cellulophaga sp. HaHaR_3_176]